MFIRGPQVVSSSRRWQGPCGHTHAGGGGQSTTTGGRSLLLILVPDPPSRISRRFPTEDILPSHVVVIPHLFSQPPRQHPALYIYSHCDHIDHRKNILSYPNTSELSPDVTEVSAPAFPEVDVAVEFLYPWLQGEAVVPVPSRSKVGVSTWVLSSWTQGEAILFEFEMDTNTGIGIWLVGMEIGFDFDFIECFTTTFLRRKVVPFLAKLGR